MKNRKRNTDSEGAHVDNTSSDGKKGYLRSCVKDPIGFARYNLKKLTTNAGTRAHVEQLEDATHGGRAITTNELMSMSIRTGARIVLPSVV